MIRRVVQASLNSAKRIRFQRQNVVEDAQTLQRWAPASRAFLLGAEQSKRTVLTELPVGLASPKEFDAMKELLLTSFHTYMPPTVAITCAEWHVPPAAPRRARVGDRFLQRVALLPIVPSVFNLGLTQLCLDFVHEVVADQANFVSITVGTTDQHDEVGLHTTTLTRDDIDGDGLRGMVVLRGAATSHFQPHVIGPARWYARLLQRRAHSLGAANFVDQLQQIPATRGQRTTSK
jgi:hypothetical protein